MSLIFQIRFILFNNRFAGIQMIFI